MATIAGSENTDVTSLSYEQARDELMRVVNKLEQGSATLEESLALWERGQKLVSRCESVLIGAKYRLDVARANSSQPDMNEGMNEPGRATKTSATEASETKS